ncbi:hypothetical protein AB0J38_27885 [Streptomyces sp. NPDC050095]|uniref:hypothetical protein n=1 Tax=unclassified Streptomyces TaxID=2593676 RepID=UPI0034134592
MITRRWLAQPGDDPDTARRTFFYLVGGFASIAFVPALRALLPLWGNFALLGYANDIVKQRRRDYPDPGQGEEAGGREERRH